MDTLKKKTLNGFIWRLLQNSSTQVVSFAISIVLARILSPEDYGLVAMITVFTNIAMVFVNTGFVSAIVQKKDLTNNDINTAFYFGMATAILIYAILFFSAPLIANFYEEPKLVLLIRVMGLTIIGFSLYSVPQSLMIRNLQLKKCFVVGLSGAVTQGTVGILLALSGKGVWALIFGAISNNVVCIIVTFLLAGWYPKLIFSIRSLVDMFLFSIKMLVSGLLDTIFNNIRSLIIGKQYSSSDLAFYNRGYQFPTLIMTQVDGAMNTVLFSSLAKYQDNWETEGIRVLRRAMRMSMYVCTPLMVGLMAVSKSLILVLLTDKWIESVSYVRLVALLCLTWPLSARKSALNAMGKSGISLVINIMGKCLTFIAIILTFRISIDALIIGTIVASFISQFIVCFIYKKHIKYRIYDQIYDVFPALAISAVMGIVVYSIEFIQLGNIVTLFIQVLVGIVIYIGLSWLFKLESFTYLWSLVKSFLCGRKINKRISDDD